MPKILNTIHEDYHMHSLNFSDGLNTINDVEVIFGVEGDLLNEEEECCFQIDGVEGEFLILSCHPQAYTSDLTGLTQGYINALQRYHERIQFIGHLCDKKLIQYIDIEAVVKAANTYKVPLEFNATYFHQGRTDVDKQKIMLNLADQIYVNSDAHTFADYDNRQEAFDYLKVEGFIQ